MSKKIFTLLGLLLFTLLLSQDVFAQQRFKAGITAGLNAAQIRGDASAGYNKLGIVGGLRAIAVFTDRTDLTIELTFSQRGSRNDPNEAQLIQIDLNYVEVPFIYHYKDWLHEEGDYYRVQAAVGLTFSRLLKAEHDDRIGNVVEKTSDFKSNDIGLLLGAEFFINKHWSISGRWNSSFNLLSEGNNSPTKNELRGYFLSFRLNYTF